MKRLIILLLLLLLLGCVPAAQALRVQISADSIAHPALPVPITQLHVECRIDASTEQARCREGQLRARVQEQPLSARFEASVQRHGDWRVQARSALRGITAANDTGRYASEKLDADLSAQVQARAGHLHAQLQAVARRGQVYAEPVFVDFDAAPARLQATLHLDPTRRRLRVPHLELRHDGVLRARGQATWMRGTTPRLAIDLLDAQLASGFATYVQPFLVGTRLEQATLSGRARGRVETHGAAVQSLRLHLDDAALDAASLRSGVHGLNGDLHWRAQGPAPASQLRWAGGHVAKLELGAATLALRSAARDVELLAPLRLPLAGGALVVDRFAVQRAGAADMRAHFDARVEPIDLAALCRAFGWPEFAGTLSGRLPGLSLADGLLRLDGALTARAFDGDIALQNLRLLDPFGRLPRLEADIRLRGLDLAALTSAFSFGRIEGRLDGDVHDLRLLDWMPVAFRARLNTPPGDDSRKRISQRAIDNLSALGGGPTGVLSRGALRFFEDFSYARIGWSCVLERGVCVMDGIGPARDGGYVLVQGRLLPRIDVVGYTRRVDWNTFVAQLASVRGQQAQVR